MSLPGHTDKQGTARVIPLRGQGRKPIDKSGELMRSRPVRMTDAQWEKCKRLGGASFLRNKIDKARE